MTRATAAARAVLSVVDPGPHVVTIGNFDGVHRGHLYLIQRVVERAATMSARSLALTFEPHPTSVLRPDLPFERLTGPDDKQRLLLTTALDDVAVIPFDLEFASLEPDEFLELVVSTVRPLAVFVGEGFRFGRGRTGDGATISEFGKTHEFETVVIDRLTDGERTISSSRIRESLHDGRLADAERALGRRHRLKGGVEHGVARGRELGYPTANLHLQRWACIPRDGIYAGYAHLSNGEIGAREAMIYIGSRPTFDNGERLVEVNILDYSGDLYSLELEIEFVRHVRDDVAFESADALVRQMAADETATRAILEHSTAENRHWSGDR